jgi:hypothetical protein
MPIADVCAVLCLLVPVRSSIKCDDVIPVEPEMARSLRAKFESWATDVERDNNNRNHSGAYDLPNDYTPVDTTKNLKAKFESFRCDSSCKPVIEKRKPRVNRFVVCVCFFLTLAADADAASNSLLLLLIINRQTHKQRSEQQPHDLFAVTVPPLIHMLLFAST